MLSRYVLFFLLALPPGTRTQVRGKVGACLGDSISMTADGGTSYCVHWAQPSLLRRMVVVAMSGVPTNDVRYLQHRDKIDGMEFDAVLVGGGTNDCTASRNPALAVADLQAIYTALKADGVTKVIAITPPPIRGYAQSTDAIANCIQSIREGVLAATDVDCAVDTFAALEDPENPGHMLEPLDSGDGRHPSDAGKQAMAAAVTAACGSF